MKPSERAFSQPSPGTYLLTVSLAQQAYRLSAFCRSLMLQENRERFRRDELAYMQSWELTPAEIGMIRAHDWLAMVRYGVNHFLVFRIAGMYGVGLVGAAAQMRGQTLEEFRRTRHVWEER
ncbi:MAG TPA: hypothetical protein VLW26_04905 [Steroidobacteraceae bacterium]|nr:hypothetical protein [Steroidobacteraceae bacterium]